MMTKCPFCAEPVKHADKACPHCGWDLTPVPEAPPDPADQRARLVVGTVLFIAIAAMSHVISGIEEDPPKRVLLSASVPEIAAAAVVTPEPMPAVTPSAPGPLLSLKAADDKAREIPARDAIDYAFELPETDQNCKLVGQMRGAANEYQPVEVFLLTADEYVFWHANPAAIPRSSWASFRGSETALDYQLYGAGTYHLVVSNVMSPTPRRVQVKAQVKCSLPVRASTR